MAGTVYFGNSNYQTWIKAPAADMTADSRSYSESTEFLNGGASVRTSKGAHREFEFSWLGSMNGDDPTTNLSVIKDFKDGLYGDEPFYWVDPFAIDQNLFAPGWAAPFLSIDYDWAGPAPDLASSPVQFSTVTTASISGSVGSNTQGYPFKTAKYEIPGAEATSYKQTFIVPDGYTLWLGFHGFHNSQTGAFAIPYDLSGVAGAETQLTPLGVNTTTRVNLSFDGSATSRVEFYFKKFSGTAGEMHITGLIAQLLPTGTTPATGKFISGRGTQSLKFSDFGMTYYNAPINGGQIGMTATMIEVIE